MLDWEIPVDAHQGGLFFPYSHKGLRTIFAQCAFCCCASRTLCESTHMTNTTEQSNPRRNHPQTKPTTTMTNTESRTSFRAAVLAVLTTDRDTWPQPVIYAERSGDEWAFDACNAPAMPSDAIAWLYVEADSFGDLAGDPEADALGIEMNMFETAVSDTEDAADLA